MNTRLTRLGKRLKASLSRMPTESHQSDRNHQASAEGNDQAQRDREALIDACINVLDYLDDPALAAKLIKALDKAGVSRLEPLGEPFDPELHEGVGWLSTSEPDLHRHIAQVAQPGYQDRSRLIRAAQVRLYQFGETAGRIKVS